VRSDEGLARAIGPVGLALSIVNVTVGGSIFVLPAALARDVGTAAPAAYLAGSVVMGLVALAFAQAGRRTSVSGGPYVYVERAFGRFPGYLAGLLTWLATIVACGAVGAALVDSLATMIPPLHQPLPRALGVVLAFGLLALVNVRGVRAGTALASMAGVAKFAGLVLFIVLAARFVQGGNLEVSLPATGAGLGRATVLVIFALAGMEIPLCAGGEIRDPARTVPRALGSATLLVALLYVTIHLIAQGVLGAGLGDSAAPLADALAGIGPAGRALILGVGAISMVGFLGGDILGQSRVLFAFARDGLLPRGLAAVHPLTRAPHVAVVVNAAIAAALAMSGSFAVLAPVASIAIVVLYIATCLAAWVVTRRQAVGGGLRGATVLLAIPGLVWVLAQSTGEEFLAVTLALGGGAVLYRVTRRSHGAGPVPAPAE
jgi:APA family basic amino acid/polyamine antiporter